VFLEYIFEMMKLAKYEKLNDGTYYGSISRIKGIWVNETSKKKCEKALWEVSEEWVLLKVYRRSVLPVLRGKRLVVPSL